MFVLGSTTPRLVAFVLLFSSFRDLQQRGFREKREQLCRRHKSHTSRPDHRSTIWRNDVWMTHLGLITAYRFCILVLSLDIRSPLSSGVDVYKHLTIEVTREHSLRLGRSWISGLTFISQCGQSECRICESWKDWLVLYLGHIPSTCCFIFSFGTVWWPQFACDLDAFAYLRVAMYTSSS